MKSFLVWSKNNYGHLVVTICMIVNMLYLFNNNSFMHYISFFCLLTTLIIFSISLINITQKRDVEKSKIFIIESFISIYNTTYAILVMYFKLQHNRFLLYWVNALLLIILRIFMRKFLNSSISTDCNFNNRKDLAHFLKNTHKYSFKYLSFELCQKFNFDVKKNQIKRVNISLLMISIICKIVYLAGMFMFLNSKYSYILYLDFTTNHQIPIYRFEFNLMLICFAIILWLTIATFSQKIIYYKLASWLHPNLE